MFRRFFSLAILCVMYKFIMAEDVKLKTNSKTETNRVKNDIVFTLVKSVEFKKLVKVLSPEAQMELGYFIDMGKSLILDNLELSELIRKYDNLYRRFKDFKQGEPIITLVLSVGGENAFDFISSTTQNFDEFTKILSEKELKELDAGKLDCEAFMQSKSKLFFNELENSDLTKELKEISGNKVFRVTAIIS